MKLQFLGTGAAEGVPAVFCQCETCKEIRRRGEKEFHTRAQYLIDDVVGIDFPPDAYYHALRFGVDLSKMRHLLVTHSHMDHFYAHDFILRGYKYTTATQLPLTIYGNKEVVRVFEECTRREMKAEVKKNFRLVEVEPFHPFVFGEKGEYVATALLAQHSANETAYVYLIEKGDKTYLHLTDTGRLPLETIEYLQGYLNAKGKTVDFVTFDCTFLYRTAGEISRHMGLEDNLVTQRDFEKRNIVDGHTVYAITHFSHNNNPLSETLKKARKEYGYIPAFDGVEFIF